MENREKEKSESITEISSLKTGTELSRSLLCKVTGFNLELAIDIHLRLLGIKKKEIHTGLNLQEFILAS